MWLKRDGHTTKFRMSCPENSHEMDRVHSHFSGHYRLSMLDIFSSLGNVLESFSQAFQQAQCRSYKDSNIPVQVIKDIIIILIIPPYN